MPGPFDKFCKREHQIAPPPADFGRAHNHARFTMPRENIEYNSLTAAMGRLEYNVPNLGNSFTAEFESLSDSNNGDGARSIFYAHCDTPVSGRSRRVRGIGPGLCGYIYVGRFAWKNISWFKRLAVSADTFIKISIFHLAQFKAVVMIKSSCDVSGTVRTLNTR